MVPSSNGQDIWFSSIKSGFDYPWDYNEKNNTTHKLYLYGFKV